MAVEETIRRVEKRGKAIDLFGGYCQWCGTVDFLEFDHINKDREDDRHLLSQLWGSSWNRILSELAKCQLLCKNCHSLKSLQDAGLEPAKHGTNAKYYNGCRCIACRGAHRVHNRKYNKNPNIIRGAK